MIQRLHSHKGVETEMDHEVSDIKREIAETAIKQGTMRGNIQIKKLITIRRKKKKRRNHQ